MSKKIIYVTLGCVWFKDKMNDEHKLLPLGCDIKSDAIAVIVDQLNGYYEWFVDVPPKIVNFERQAYKDSPFTIEKPIEVFGTKKSFKKCKKKVLKVLDRYGMLDCIY